MIFYPVPPDARAGDLFVPAITVPDTFETGIIKEEYGIVLASFFLKEFILSCRNTSCNVRTCEYGRWNHLR